MRLFRGRGGNINVSNCRCVISKRKGTWMRNDTAHLNALNWHVREPRREKANDVNVSPDGQMATSTNAHYDFIRLSACRDFRRPSYIDPTYVSRASPNNLIFSLFSSPHVSHIYLPSWFYQRFTCLNPDSYVFSYESRLFFLSALSFFFLNLWLFFLSLKHCPRIRD